MPHDGHPLHPFLTTIRQALDAGESILTPLLRQAQQTLKLEELILRLFLSENHPGRQLASPAFNDWTACPGRTGSDPAPEVADFSVFPLPPLSGTSATGLLLAKPAATAKTSSSELDTLALLVSLALREEPQALSPHATPVRPGRSPLEDAENLDDLARRLLKQAMRDFDAVAVTLRQVYGGTILGQSQTLLPPGKRHLKQLVQALEEEHALRLLRQPEGPILVQLANSSEPPLPARTYLILPLQRHGRLFGIASLLCAGPAPDAAGSLATGEQTPLHRLADAAAIALERLDDRDRLAAYSSESHRVFRETSILFRISRAMQSTLHLDELTHLTLSAATRPHGGGFGRAMLFMYNRRSRTLQGMLGVSRESALLVFPDDLPGTWETPQLGQEIRHEQRDTELCRKVTKQRVQLDDENDPLVRAVKLGRVVIVRDPARTRGATGKLARELQLSPFACAPLLSRGRLFGVLLVDNPETGEGISPDRLRFLELFAGLAGAAMENAMLHHRLETAHRELIFSQEQLVQGEKLAGLGEMAASVAHEMKNPLTIIGGFARRLHDHLGSDGNLKEYAGIIHREVRRMEVLLDDILAFSRKQILCLEECRLPALLDESLKAVADQIARARIKIRTSVAADLPAIQADPLKLRQVLINLLTNARQAIGENGEIRLEARRSRLRGNDAVSIEIEDTGGGIPQDILRNIFNPFFTTKEGGTGVGLSICHRIVDHHHGTISVENVYKGARFTINLPVNQNPSPTVDKRPPFG